MKKVIIRPNWDSYSNVCGYLEKELGFISFMLESNLSKSGGGIKV